MNEFPYVKCFAQWLTEEVLCVFAVIIIKEGAEEYISKQIPQWPLLSNWRCVFSWKKYKPEDMTKRHFKIQQSFWNCMCKGKKNDNFSDEELKQYSNQVIEYEWESSQGCFSAWQTRLEGEKKIA